ncbi:MAG: hypothetical protein C3F06_14820 [Candidatus Methanoperedenaceae archaeon]|nr:MAG: hypothetical protein C3F06_14820 [Candidatus Methanoperedenaceae archaeon]
MNKAYTFRIYPNRNQETKLNRTLSICRHLYNDALEERRRQAELNRIRREFQVFPWEKPEWISYEDQQNALPDSKTPLQKQVHSQVLQNALKRLDRSFQNFFKGFGYPRFTVDIDKKVEKVPIKTRTGIDVGLESLLTLSSGLIRFTNYKAEYAGKWIELVDPYWTSQTCLCGADVPKDLSIRIHICHECGLILNRDHVSAIIIENRGTRSVPMDCREFTPVETKPLL